MKGVEDNTLNRKCKLMQPRFTGSLSVTETGKGEIGGRFANEETTMKALESKGMTPESPHHHKRNPIR